MKKFLFLILFVLFVTTTAQAVTTITRYVDPNASGAGDGTTRTDAYTSLKSWEAGEQQDLTDGDKEMVVHCFTSGGSADTSSLAIFTWTTGAANTIKIVVDQADRHDGKWNTSKYRLDVASGIPLDILEEFVWVDGLQVQGNDFSGCIKNNVSGASQLVQISNCVIDALSGNGIYIGENANSITTIWNTVVFGSPGDEGIYADYNTTTTIYNCTVYNFDDGIEGDNGDVVVTNTACYNNGNDFDTAGASFTITFCASDDGDGTDSVQPADWDAVFENDGGGDFHLKSTDTDLIGAGTDDPGSGLFDDDIDGETRTSTWDIGADEFVIAATTFIPDIKWY